jgi:hypothetical protein
LYIDLRYREKREGERGDFILLGGFLMLMVAFDFEGYGGYAEFGFEEVEGAIVVDEAYVED